MKGLCADCILTLYCKRNVVEAVREAEVLNPDFIHDVRVFAYSLGISRDRWINVLSDWLCDFPGRIVGPNGLEVFLDTEVFELPNIRDWFDDTCCTLPSEYGARYVRTEARERFRIMATILKAKFPKKAVLWGVRAANDNDPPATTVRES